MRLKALSAIAAVLVGIAAAFVMDAAFDLARFAPGASRACLGIACLTALGGVQAAAWNVIGSKELRFESALRGAVIAGLTTFLLVRAPLPWLDLGPFGAGAIGELAILVAPLAQLLAVIGSVRDQATDRR